MNLSTAFISIMDIVKPTRGCKQTLVPISALFSSTAGP